MPGITDTTKAASRIRRLADMPIALKLRIMVGVLVVVVLATLVLVYGAFQLTTGVRAYVGGESLWSKAQKDATYHLVRYARSGQQESYLEYRRAIAVPLSIRRAREEMNRESFDPEKVRREFVASGIHSDDAPYMITLYRHFGWVSYLREAIEIWAQADFHIEELIAVAEDIHRQRQQPQPNVEQIQRLLTRLDQVNGVLTPLELRFSEVLGEGARWLRATLMVSIAGSSGMLLILALAVTRQIGFQLRSQVAALKAGAARVAGGELSHPIPSPAGDELGEVAHAFNAMAAQRMQIERRSEQDAEFLRAMLENLSDGIVACDADGTLSLFNRATRNFHGIHEEAIPPEQWAEHFSLYHPDGKTLLSTEDIPLYRALKGERLRDVEIVIAPAEGPRRTVSCNGRALLDKDGKILGAVVAMHDITERKAAEHRLREHADELARSNAELERFAYVASHDLQEPLRTVASYTQLLLRRMPEFQNEDQRLFADQIRAGVGRMQDLIEGLLAYSRASREAQVNRPVDLRLVLDAALANLDFAIRDAHASIDVDPLPTVLGDQRQLTQVFQNLIGNALKFSGGESPRVEIKASQLGPEWQLRVRDYGVGIDPRYADQVFGLFKRLHTSDEYPGTGVGLTICKRIIEQHGGRIWIEPCARGACLVLALPAQEAAEAANQPV